MFLLTYTNLYLLTVEFVAFFPVSFNHVQSLLFAEPLISSLCHQLSSTFFHHTCNVPFLPDGLVTKQWGENEHCISSLKQSVVLLCALTVLWIVSLCLC